jgi:MFS family permease
MNLQPLYMKAEGFRDAETASFISWRFAGVLALAFPLGLFIRGKKVKHFFYISSIGVPLFAMMIVLAVQMKNIPLLIISQSLWGACFTFIQIPILPFIIRHASAETQTPAISLSYSTWSLAGIAGAGLVFIFNSIDPVIFSERNMLIGISVLSFSGVFFLLRMKIDEHVVQQKEMNFSIDRGDRKLIASATLPTLVIATGAGLTIPFINLFFSDVHHLSTDQISLWNFVAAFVVAFAALLVPVVKDAIGYRTAVPMTQSLAVIALVLMATTQCYSGMRIAIVVAVCCYVIRQPLMNMAGPMTSEIAMKYVGKKNREITSALLAAIWSGSWFISTRFIFAPLRNTGWPYVSIFLITAALYTIGILLFMLLIHAFTKKQKKGLIEE